MKRGDTVQLKVPEQGRYFKGKILKETSDGFQVGLPNGLYVIKSKELWEICESSETDSSTDILEDDLK